MKIFILLCVASSVFANQPPLQAMEVVERAKQALDQLTFSKEENIFNVNGFVEKEEGDPCQNTTCQIGWECTVDPVYGDPFCACATSCPPPDVVEEDIHRTHVCSTRNTSFANLCEFHREKCLSDELKYVDVDYYGDCSEIPTCQPRDLDEFPHRMTQWFIESLEYLMEMSEEHGGLSQREIEILKEPRRPEGQAIFWKFRRLDKNPADLYLDFNELEALRAPIVLLEPCTKPFLASCDVDADGRISAIEFGRCLLLQERDIEY